MTIVPHGFAYQMGLDWTSHCAPQGNMVMLPHSTVEIFFFVQQLLCSWFCAIIVEQELHLNHSQEVHGS